MPSKKVFAGIARKNDPPTAASPTNASVGT